MEDNIKIKLNIGDRLYPLTIQRSQEFYFREAAKVIENTIKNLEENYSVRDKQDLLAMCLIEYASKLEKINQNNIISDDGISEKLSKLDKLLSDFK